MKKFDLNCFSGNWPFYKNRYNTIEKLARQHKKCGIEGGLVSSLEAIFYQDPYEAEVALSKEIAGTGYCQAMTLNPTLPAWKEDLDRCVKELGIKAVRLVPGYHGYLLTDPVMDDLCDALRQYNLPLVLTLRLGDERTVWLVKPRLLSADELVAFLTKNKDIPTLLANVRLNESFNFKEMFAQRQNLFMDTSGFMRGLFPVDDAFVYSNGQLVFGSNAPLFEMQCFTYLTDRSLLTAQQKAALYTGGGFASYLKD